MYTGTELPLSGAAPQVGFDSRTWVTDATFPAVINSGGAVSSAPTNKFYASYGDETLTSPVTTATGT